MIFPSKFFRTVAFLISLTVLSAGAQAQSNSVKCHVYVVDKLRAQRALEKFESTGDDEKDAKQLNVGVTTFPEFSPTLGEEELTTKHYLFPGSSMFITASIFTTDESMASAGTGDVETNSNSVSLGIMLGDRKFADAFSPAPYPNSVAEVTLDDYTNHARVKQWVTVKKRQYLIGLECDFLANKRQKQEKPKP